MTHPITGSSPIQHRNRVLGKLKFIHQHIWMHAATKSRGGPYTTS